MSITKVITFLMLSVIVLGSAGSALSSQAQAGQAGSLDPSLALDVTRGRARVHASDDGMQRLKQQGRYASLVAAVEATRYQVSQQPATGAGLAAYEAANPKQGFAVSFGPGGMQMRPTDAKANWRLGMRLSAWGYGESYLVPGNAVISASGNRVEYRYGRAGETAVTEWYVNTTDGIEQGFTLARPPAGDGRSKPLTLVVTVSGDLAPRLVADGNAIELVGADATPVLRYAKLRVWDATGRTLPSRLAVDSGQVRLLADDTSAVYPVTVDPLVYTETKLTPNDGGGEFGFSVAISEDATTVVVGAPAHGTNLVGQASVYVRSGTSWSEQAKLAASDGAMQDQFGSFVAISGDTVVIGAPFHTTDGKAGAGQAYVYLRSGTTWTEQAKLKASDGAADDNFGSSVGISGGTVVVGAPYHNTGGTTDAGQGYVYVRSGTTWSEQAKLAASTPAATDLFGFWVGISGETVIVGASGFVTDTSKPVGHAYVYVRTGASWSEQAKLTGSDSTAGDLFGNEVAISGDTVVVGAPFHSSQAGQAYVYVRSGTTWSEQAKLVASDGAAVDVFGALVAISGDIVVVGAQLHNTDGKPDAGQAYVYVRSGTTWSEQAKLKASDAVAQDEFGWSAAVSGDTVVVGAPFHAPCGPIPTTCAGQAYVYDLAVVAPDITVSPLSLAFGTVSVGSVSSVQTVTVRNDGTASLILRSIALGGANPNQFKKPALKDLCSGNTLSPTQTCTVKVKFKPTNGGVQSAVLMIPSNDPDASVVAVALDGAGGGPEMAVSPLSLSFGTVSVGSVSSVQTVTVRNDGTASLTLGSIALGGANLNQFKKPALKDLCSGNTLSPTQTCTVKVKFKPTNGGPQSSTLVISSNDFNESSVPVTLGGTGL